MKTSEIQHPTPSMEEQLLEAAREGNTEKLEYVLSYGTVNLSVTDPDNGATALHLACKNIQPQIVKLLLENGLNINAVDSIQNTPLHLAALMGHKEIVTLLLDNGADLAIQNVKSETAETLASTDEIRQLIKARPGLRQFQQEQLGMKTASASQATDLQVDEDRQLAEQLQQQELLSAKAIGQRSSEYEMPKVSAAFPPAERIEENQDTSALSFIIPNFTPEKRKLTEDLGGKVDVIDGGETAKIMIESSLLKKDKRDLLGIDRKLITLGNMADLIKTELGFNKNLTIESAQNSKILLTFPSKYLEFVTEIVDMEKQITSTDVGVVIQNRMNSKLEKIKELYTSKNYNQAAEHIKYALKFYNEYFNGKRSEIEFELIKILGDIYLEKNADKKDLQDYPKAIALYQYARRMIVINKEKLLGEKNHLIDVDKKLAGIEESFVKSIASSNLHYKCDLSLIKGYKKALEDFRLSLKPRLDAIKELGVENDELNEEKLYERAKIVEAIYSDIEKFFISHEESNKGLLVRLIEQTKTILGPVPHKARYAVIGLGSMALGTMTPWSDIEFAILIQEGLDEKQTKEVKDYFYKLTTLFHMSIINLGETELAAMSIKELNDFTQVEHDDWFWDKLMPDGVSFDAQRPIGCKTPSGRSGFTNYRNYDLICTPIELTKYQDEWADRESTLPQLMLNTVLIEGSDRVQEEASRVENELDSLLNVYHQLIRQKLDQKEDDGLSCIQQRSLDILRRDSEKYNPFKIIQDVAGKLFEAKKEIYRYPDRIFVAISNYFDICNLSQWISLRKLSKSDSCRTDEETKRSLMIAFSIACELRLSASCNNIKQSSQFSAFQSSAIESVKPPFLLAS